MLRGSLRGIVETVSFDEANVRPDARPEELSLEEWIRLTRAVTQ